VAGAGADDLVVDVVVVGGGPGGLSAATWVARHRRSVCVVDSGEYRNRWVRSSHGYLAHDPASPSVLAQRAHAQLHQYERVTIHRGRVAEVHGTAGSFTVLLADGRRVRTLALVLATGVTDVFPDIAGFFDHYGTSVFHCPTCDGYEARDRRVAVFGWDSHVIDFALALRRWAGHVTVVSDGRAFPASDRARAGLAAAGVDVVEDEALALVGRTGSLAGVRLRGGTTLDCRFAFFTIEQRANTALARQLGCSISLDGYVNIDDEGRTSVAGVYAAGDLVPGLQLVQVAAGEGARAGVNAAMSLR
jgi:thioredoxin reductase